MQAETLQKQVVDAPSPMPGVRFFVFKNQRYIQKNDFAQPRVIIGSNPNADLVLNHGSVADFHAHVAYEEEALFLTNFKPENGMRVNGQAVEKIRLEGNEIIDLGPFTMMVGDGSGTGTLVERNPIESLYQVVLINNFPDTATREQVAVQLSSLFKKSPRQILQLLGRPRYGLRQPLDIEKALRFMKMLQAAGAACILRPAAAVPSAADPARARAPEPETAEKPVASPVSASLQEEDDDDDDLPADFLLSETLSVLSSATMPERRKKIQGATQLEVVKTVGRRVVEVTHLTGRGKFHVNAAGRRMVLGRYAAAGSGWVFFPGSWEGLVLSGGRRTALSEYKTHDYLYRKRSDIYRISLAPGDAVILEDGDIGYQIRHSHRYESPVVPAYKSARAITWRHFATSFGFHLFMVILMSIVFAVATREIPDTAPHFVKIDMSQFAEKAPAPEVKKPPVKAPPPPKPKAVKPTEKKTTAKKKSASAPVQTTRKTRKKVSKTAAPSRHPKAGGGYGEGNIANRNVNQTGLLSLLGDGAAPVSGAALASVTNLDAVAVPGAGENQFKVGGIKGSLGSAKITLATGPAVGTKGGAQVLRSAGEEGPGTVAALDKGAVGGKQVRGMVTARMNRAVSVQGGMSREMVKRVIDQHLAEVQYCYESALMENPAIMGRIVYEWKILMSGRVGEIRIVASSVNSHQIHDCIKSAIKSWQFPKPVGAEVVVSYPFVFDLVGF